MSKRVPEEVAHALDARRLGLGELFSQARDAVIVAEVEAGRIVLWNDAAAAIFGYSRAEALGLPLAELVPADLRDQHHAGIATFIETGHGPLIDADDIIEVPGLAKDGEKRWVELTLTPLEGADVPGRYVMAVVRDVSERRATEEAMRRALEQESDLAARLRELNEMKDTFVATLAHDLRSPLASMKGFAELLGTHWSALPEERRRDLLDRIVVGANRLSELIDAVLDSAALEAGQLQLSLEAVDLDDLVGEVVEHERATTGAQFEVTVAHDLPSVPADPRRIRQILTNLVANALKFGPEAGPVHLDVIGGRHSVEIAVRDEGPGVGVEDIPRIFQKFFRSSSPTLGSVEGTGLGLYICNSLVEAHGGVIWVENHPDGGAVFRFRLLTTPAGR